MAEEVPLCAAEPLEISLEQATAEPVMTRARRHYVLHREKRKEKERERYNNDPKVIARREEHALKKVEKEAKKQEEKARAAAQKAAEKQERDRIRYLEIERIALATSKRKSSAEKS